MYPFPVSVNWPESGPTHQMNWQLLRGLDSNIDGWVGVAKQYLLVGYLYRQLRDLRPVYTGGPKPSTEGGTQDFDTRTGFIPLSCVGKSLSVKKSLFLILPNTSLASGTLRKMNAATEIRKNQTTPPTVFH